MTDLTNSRGRVAYDPESGTIAIILETATGRHIADIQLTEAQADALADSLIHAAYKVRVATVPRGSVN